RERSKRMTSRSATCGRTARFCGAGRLLAACAGATGQSTILSRWLRIFPRRKLKRFYSGARLISWSSRRTRSLRGRLAAESRIGVGAQKLCTDIRPKKRTDALATSYSRLVPAFPIRKEKRELHTRGVGTEN